MAGTTPTAISRLTVVLPANAGARYPLKNSNFPSSSGLNGHFPPPISSLRTNRRLKVLAQTAGAPSKDVSALELAAKVGQDRLLKVMPYILLFRSFIIAMF